jgi:hypothetical protein
VRFTWPRRLGFDVKLNHRALGFTQHKVFLGLANISTQSVERLIDHLMQLIPTICISKSIGISDLEFEALVRNDGELHAILRNLRYTFPDLIRDESSLIVSREAYVNYLPWKK